MRRPIFLITPLSPIINKVNIKLLSSPPTGKAKVSNPVGC